MPLFIGLFCEKWPINIRLSTGLRHAVPGILCIEYHTKEPNISHQSYPCSKSYERAQYTIQKSPMYRTNEPYISNTRARYIIHKDKNVTQKSWMHDTKDAHRYCRSIQQMPIHDTNKRAIWKSPPTQKSSIHDTKDRHLYSRAIQQTPINDTKGRAIWKSPPTQKSSW